MSRVSTEFAGLGLLGMALLSTLALATYSPADPVFELANVVNRAGVVGATLAGWLFGAIGWGAPVAVGCAAWVGGRLVLGMGVPGPRSRFWPGAILLLISLTSLPPVLHVLAPGRLGSELAGGLGSFLVAGEVMLLSSWGALLLNFGLFVLGVLNVLGISTGRALTAVGSGSALAGGLAHRGGSAIWQGMRQLLARVSGALTGGLHELRGRLRLPSFALPRRFNRLRRSGAADAKGEATGETAEEEEQEEDSIWEPPAMPEVPEPASVSDSEDEEIDDVPGSASAEPPHIVDHEQERSAKRKPSQETFEFRDEDPSGPYVMPDVSIFQLPNESARAYDRDSLLMNSRILEKKLSDFGVKGRVVRVHPGPVITMYEYEPASGIKVNRIVNLTDDLAMALRAISIRIIAPLPGKSVVGIEIPNPQRDTVYLRSLLDAETFRKSKDTLAVAMGHDIFGNAVVADLARMPHLLVAGATGTGKSVFLNAFLCSLLCRARPDELKLLLVDPKLLELSIYEGIPHLIADVVTNPKRAAAALQGIVRKMEERYQMMSATKVRNIMQFNAKVDAELAAGNTTFRLKPKPGEEEGKEVEYQRLPYIVVVIDELADLMVLAAKDVEESLQRLAQMARASGIHLVLATQRPSVDVLTGVIKANFPSRVSFQVSSGIDSRTVLDQRGSENLLGMGDMLFLPPGTSVLQRLHGALVTEKEVEALVSHLKQQGKPVFDEYLANLPDPGDSDSPSGGEDIDEMFDDAVAIVVETRNASISYIQRRLKIGYNRAARIIEEMESQQMVGPQVGTRGRDVYLRAADDEDE